MARDTAMDFREIIQLYWEERRIFILIIAISVFGALLWQVNQSLVYRADLLLNIGRSGIQKTPDYSYDNFYRLQADERFGDTVVRWLQSPRVVSDILLQTDIRPESSSERELGNMIVAKRLSSQVIETSFTNAKKDVLEKESEVIVKVLNEYTAGLNQGGSAEGWFLVVGSNPVIIDARATTKTAIIFGMAAGVFFAFWSIALKRYFSAD